MFKPEDIVFSYSTSDAVNDSVLFKADPELVTQAGIKIPVFITDTVWNRYIGAVSGVTAPMDTTQRLMAILSDFSWAARSCQQSTLLFNINCQVPASKPLGENERETGFMQFRTVTLKAVITASDVDNPAPAIFIMKPSED